MAYQSGHNVAANVKLETTFGIKPVVVTGATRFRWNPSAGLRLGQVLITPSEIRSDGNSSAARNGSRSVTGSLVCDVTYGGAVDLGLEAAHRGTWATDVLSTANPPTPRSFTIEEVETDIDATSVYKGCRFGGYTLTLAPDQPATLEFPVVGADAEVLTGGAAPYFTPVTPTTTDMMVATDAAISVDGVAVVEFSACSITLDNGAAGVPLIGTNITPEVWTNNNRVNGSITTLRQSVVRQQAYLDGTEFELSVILSDVAGNTIEFTVPRCLFTDYTKNMGADGPLMVTMPWTAGYDSTATPASMIYVTRNPV
jgi:hypothetical protein